jgi:hypothetical protein
MEWMLWKVACAAKRSSGGRPGDGQVFGRARVTQAWPSERRVFVQFSSLPVIAQAAREISISHRHVLLQLRSKIIEFT